MQRFGEKLRRLRKQRGMTIVGLAAALGYTANSFISELENGKKQPSVDVVIKIAQFFGVSTDALLLDHLELPGPAEAPES